MSIKTRKKDHIKYFMESFSKSKTMFEDVYIDNDSLPNLDFDSIDTSIEFLGKKISYPFMINAMTGGQSDFIRINKDFAKIAKKYNIPMAVGSEKIALKDKNAEKSFSIVRDIIENGLVIGNLSARSSMEDVIKAQSIIEADAIQLHLNVAQELAMREGDRDFSGVLDNIININSNFDKKIIVKEVGFGISKKVAKTLIRNKINIIDIGAYGGTNFIEIEDKRNKKMDFKEMYTWGIPTAKSIIDTRSVSEKTTLIASGGIRNSMDMMKSIVLGADLVGVSGMFLNILLNDGYDKLDRYIEDLIYKFKMLMMLVGAKDIKELKKVDYKLKGELYKLQK